MDCNVSIGCSEGRAQNPGRGRGRGGWQRSKDRGGEMTALPSRVPNYTTNLTTPKIVIVPELGRWSGMSLRQWRRMLEVVMPKVVVVSKLGQ